MNIANKLTFLRILLIPVMAVVYCLGWKIAAAVIFVLAAVTDIDVYKRQENNDATAPAETAGETAAPTATQNGGDAESAGFPTWAWIVIAVAVVAIIVVIAVVAGKKNKGADDNK